MALGIQDGGEMETQAVGRLAPYRDGAVQAICFGIRVCEFSVNLGLTETLAGHLEEPHQVVVLAGVIGDLNDLCKVRGIFSFDIRI
jgi:hypothetical protein